MKEERLIAVSKCMIQVNEAGMKKGEESVKELAVKGEGGGREEERGGAGGRSRDEGAELSVRNEARTR